MNPTPNDLTVRHNSADSRFEVTVDGLLSVADYERAAGEIALTHTYVPVELRGRGIAEKLVRVALEFARAEQLKVVPACSYVEAFIARHAEFQPLLK
jgi:uncharacterized protein